MIDLHMHILPELDDGAETIETALEMAYMALETGTEAVAATPHANFGMLTVDEYMERLAYFQTLLKEMKIPLEVYSGMEILMGPKVEEKLARGELLSLNETKYVLTEFDFTEDSWNVDFWLEGLSKAGYIPVIAHPERYRFVQQDPQMVYEWAQRGYVTQVNKGSFVGRFGRSAQNMAMSLLRHNLVNIIASDAHGVHQRTPDMEAVKYFLSDYIDEEYLDLLLEKNPRNILLGEDILVYPEKPYI